MLSLVWIHNDAHEYKYPNSEVKKIFYELIRVLVYIGRVNYLCKLALCLPKFAYLWILVWIHKDPWEYAYGTSEIHLFFQLIGVLVSIGHENFVK